MYRVTVIWHGCDPETTEQDTDRFATREEAIEFAAEMAAELGECYDMAEFAPGCYTSEDHETGLIVSVETTDEDRPAHPLADTLRDMAADGSLSVIMAEFAASLAAQTGIPTTLVKGRQKPPRNAIF